MKLLRVQKRSSTESITLLLLRVVIGSAFMFHGYSKIQNPFAWMGDGAGTPGIFQALAAVSEFGGGLAWILGLLTPIASLGIISTMSVALFTHVIMRGDPFVGKGPAYELALVYWSAGLLIFTFGPGAFSLDKKFFGKK